MRDEDRLPIFENQVEDQNPELSEHQLLIRINGSNTSTDTLARSIKSRIEELYNMRVSHQAQVIEILIDRKDSSYYVCLCFYSSFTISSAQTNRYLIP